MLYTNLLINWESSPQTTSILQGTACKVIVIFKLSWRKIE